MYTFVLNVLPAWFLAALSFLLAGVYVYRQKYYGRVSVTLPKYLRVSQTMAALLVGFFELYVEWGGYRSIFIPAAFSRLAILSVLLSGIHVQLWIICAARGDKKKWGC